MSKVGAKLLEWRKAKGWTQEEAAVAAGVSQGRWSVLERTEIPVTVAFALRIEKLTGGKVRVREWACSEPAERASRKRKAA